MADELLRKPPHGMLTLSSNPGLHLGVKVGHRYFNVGWGMQAMAVLHDQGIRYQLPGSLWLPNWGLVLHHRRRNPA